MNMHEKPTCLQPQEHILKTIISSHHKHILMTIGHLMHNDFIMHKHPGVCAIAISLVMPDTKLKPICVDDK
jgi:hypothetical protein